MAAEGAQSSSLEQLMREVMESGGGGGGGGEGRRSRFHPILVGVTGPPPSAEGDPAPPPDRIVLVNPVTQGMVVLQGDPAVVAELLSDRLLSARRRGDGPPPASKASIDAMSTVEIAPRADGGVEECPVCLDALAAARCEEGEMGGTGVVKEMPCGHRFHGECIGKWLGMHGSCPVCRFAMPAEDEGEAQKGAGGDDPVEGEGEEEEEGEEGEERRGTRRRRRRRGVWVTIVYGQRGSSGDDQQQQQQEEHHDQQQQQEQLSEGEIDRRQDEEEDDDEDDEEEDDDEDDE